MQTDQIILLMLVWVPAINIVGFLAMWLDKRFAQSGARRIPEKTLLGLALIGGSAGAKMAQHRFRHKTRKQPFRSFLNLIVVLQIAAVGFLVLYLTGLKEV